MLFFLSISIQMAFAKNAGKRVLTMKISLLYPVPTLFDQKEPPGGTITDIRWLLFAISGKWNVSVFSQFWYFPQEIKAEANMQNKI